MWWERGPTTTMRHLFTMVSPIAGVQALLTVEGICGRCCASASMEISLSFLEFFPPVNPARPSPCYRYSRCSTVAIANKPSETGKC